MIRCATLGGGQTVNQCDSVCPVSRGVSPVDFSGLTRVTGRKKKKHRQSKKKKKSSTGRPVRTNWRTFAEEVHPLRGLTGEALIDRIIRRPLLSLPLKLFASRDMHHGSARTGVCVCGLTVLTRMHKSIVAVGFFFFLFSSNLAALSSIVSAHSVFFRGKRIDFKIYAQV